jgi:hypothetical protein
MAPTILVEFCFEALRHPGLLALRRLIAPEAGQTGRSEVASVGAFPRHLRMSFTHPAVILTKRAFHVRRLRR